MYSIPWRKLSVDIIGPYIVRIEACDDPIILKFLTVIDLSTGWFEMVQYNYKQSDTLANLVEQTWLCQYPRPTIIAYNRGNEFLGRAFKNNLIKNRYGIKAKCATTANPQVNSILEIIYQVISNLVHMFDCQNNYLYNYDPWSGILLAMDFVVQITYHTNLPATPVQLVFGRNMISNTPFVADWEAIRTKMTNLKIKHLNCTHIEYGVHY